MKEEALKASIRAWRKKYKLLSENVNCTIMAWTQDVDENCAVRRRGKVVGRIDLGPRACPLCEVYLCKRAPGSFQRCHGCPVSAKTGEHGCDKTPYSRFVDLLPDWLYGGKARISKAMVEACKAELDFLVSLLPTKKKAPKTVRQEGQFVPGDRVELLVDGWNRKKGERATLVEDDRADILHRDPLCMPLLLKFRNGNALWFRRDQVKLVRKAEV